MPLAIKIFFLSLVSGVAGGYGAFRLALFIAAKFFDGELAEIYVAMIAVAAALLVGMASAVTAGVLAGRSTQSKAVKV